MSKDLKFLQHPTTTSNICTLPHRFILGECECRVAQDFKLKINPTKIRTYTRHKFLNQIEKATIVTNCMINHSTEWHESSTILKIFCIREPTSAWMYWTSLTRNSAFSFFSSFSSMSRTWCAHVSFRFWFLLNAVKSISPSGK